MTAPAPLVAAQVPPADRLVAPALVVVDMQNDFVRAGAPLEVPDARATIAATSACWTAFRERGLPVLFTRFLSLEADNLCWRWSPECHPGDARLLARPRAQLRRRRTRRARAPT